MVNIGFISTRFAGQDEVLLESANWAVVLWAAGKRVSFWCGGRNNRLPSIFHCVPYAHFTFTDNEWINRCICRVPFDAKDSLQISKVTSSFKRMLHLFVKKYHFVPNVFLREKNPPESGQLPTTHEVTSGANELWINLFTGRGFEATNDVELLISSGNPAFIKLRGGLCFES
jgi:hypothetical protein